MTGYTVHTGSTQDFSEGWDRVFGDASKTRTGKKSAKKSPSTATSKKKTATGKAADQPATAHKKRSKGKK